MSSPVATVGPETSLADAVHLMILRGIGNLVVANGELVLGVITERELLQHVVLNKGVPNKQVKYISSQRFTKVTPDTSVIDAAKIMISKKARLLVFQKDKLTGSDHLLGIITASDIVRAFAKTDRNPSIDSAMTNKVYTIRPDNTILTAAKIMLKRGIGSVVVTENGSPYGIFTERDLLNRILTKAIDVEDRVGAYSTTRVATSEIGTSGKAAARVMLSRKIKRLPLTKDGRIVAMVTARDLVEAFQRSN